MLAQPDKYLFSICSICNEVVEIFKKGVKYKNAIYIKGCRECINKETERIKESD